MTKYSYIGISFIILVFGIIFVPRIVDRVSGFNTIDHNRMSLNNPTANHKLAYLKIDGQKKKIPEFVLTNQDSLLITHHDFKGKVTIVDFFFINCPTICPKMTRNLSYLEKSFQDEVDFSIASFTINPEYDTPIALKKYSQSYNVTHPNWHFLTGDKTQIYNLAKNGFNLFAEQNPKAAGGFEHSGYFALIDKEGFLRSRYDEFGNPIIYYRGTISLEEQKDANGEQQQITILEQDIKKLLKNDD